MRLVFLDTETTGLLNGRLVQLAYEIYDSNERVSSIPYEKKFKPPVPISIEAMATHHITEKMVENCGKFTPNELGKVLETHIMVAHNAPFDIGILENEGVPRPKYWIDTKKVAQYYIDAEAYNLQYLRYFLGLEIEAIAHDALGDITVLKEVFMKIFEIALCKEKFDDENIDDHNLIRKFVEISMNPMELRKMPFGKYKGMTFEEIRQQDLQYLLWLRKDLSTKEGNEDLLYTLSLYI
jgi:DNA polymerase III epsilon subunit-like protein